MGRDNASLLVQQADLSIGSVTVTRGLDITLYPGEFWGILGPNGVGKTTLLKAIAGLYPLDSGSVVLEGQPITDMNRRAIAQRLGMLVQDTPYAFDATLLETALMGRHPHLTAWQQESQQDRDWALEILALMGLGDLAHRSCMDLSGGESRRLALASVLVQDPAILLLDEPTNHLDPANQVSVLNVVGQLIRSQNRCGLMALHEVNLATCYCSHCLMLFGEGEWLAGPTETILTTDNLSRLYRCPVRLVDDGQHKVFAVAGPSPS